MKSKAERQSEILSLVSENEIETQEELCERLNGEGFAVTQATVSRDIRELGLTKAPAPGGRQRYAAGADAAADMTGKYARVLREGFVSMDYAGNILVIKTVAGMGSAVGAAVDAMNLPGMIGSIAGDDTLMCVIRTQDAIMEIMRIIKLNLD
ncbi:MAG: arginine repressor [Clostridiales bacterium]|nr:arginine repressor [Clostridiales bacterium]